MNQNIFKLIALTLLSSFASTAQAAIPYTTPLLEVPAGTILQTIQPITVPGNSNLVVEGNSIGGGAVFNDSNISYCILYGNAFQATTVVIPAGTAFTITQVGDALPQYPSHIVRLFLSAGPNFNFFCTKLQLNGPLLTVGDFYKSSGAFFQLKN